MMWLLLVVSLIPMPAENMNVDDPNADTSLQLAFRQSVVTLGGVFGSESGCHVKQAAIASDRTSSFCVQAK